MNAYRTWIAQVGSILAALTVSVSLAHRFFFVEPVFNRPKLKLQPGTETLIIGASHSASAFDTSRFRHSESMAASGELVIFTAAKLEVVLRQNEGVKSVVMALSPIHLSARQDTLLLSANAGTRTTFIDNYAVLSKESRRLVAGWNSNYVLARLKYDFGLPLGYTEDIRLYASSLQGTLSPRDYRFWGAYTPQNGSHVGKDFDAKVIRKYFYLGGDHTKSASGEALYGKSRIAEAQVRKILEMGTSRGLRMILVRTPESARFRESVPPFFKASFAALLREIQRDFPAVEYYDLSAELTEDSLFLDADHLNGRGSAIFSERFAARMGIAATR
jgi:hypothetical protein